MTRPYQLREIGGRAFAHWQIHSYATRKRRDSEAASWEECGFTVEIRDSLDQSWRAYIAENLEG